MNPQVIKNDTRTNGGPLELVKKYNALIGMLVVLGIVAVFKPQLIAVGNIQTIVIQASVLCVLAVGLACAMSMKAIDLSVAAGADRIGYVAALIVMANHSVGLAIAVGIGIAVVVGLTNGLMAGYLGVPAIVSTLAMNLILTTVLLIVSNNGASVQLFTSHRETVRSFLMLGGGSIGPVRILVLIVIAVVAVMWFATTRTTWGRRVDLVESSSRAGYLSGVPIRFVFMSGFVVSAVIAALAGILLASRTGVAVPGNATPLLLEAFTAVYVGAIACPSGRIKVLWTVVGAVFVTTLANALTLLGLGADWRTGLNGLLIIGAITISAAKRRRG